MKKKATLVTLLALFVLILASVSFAHRGDGATGYSGPSYGHMWNADLSEEELEAWHTERMAFTKESVATYLEDGKITQEQHDAWMERIEAMETFHEENGFTTGYGMGHDYGGCHGYSIAQ